MSWVEAKDRLPEEDGIFTVEDHKGDTFKCYFYLDKICWIAHYGRKTSYWWKKSNGEAVFDVVRWREYEK